jgi:hypothetical protein
MITVPLAGWEPIRGTGTPSLTYNRVVVPDRKS